MSTVLILLRSDLKAFEAKLETMLETKFELLETKFERVIGSQERSSEMTSYLQGKVEILQKNKR